MQENLQIIKNFFQNLQIADIIDIALVALVIFLLFLATIKFGHPNLAFLFTIATLVTFACKLFNLKYAFIVMLTLMALSTTFFAIVFTTDLRRALYSHRTKNKKKHQKNYDNTEEELISCRDEIIKALQNMAKNNVGALVVLTFNNIDGAIVDSGTRLGATVTSQLLESIFINKSPLHDGAVIIEGDKLVAAGCFLPLSQQLNIPKEYGTRHRAGLGITEENNELISIIVSEETGIISIAENGVLSPYADTKILKDTLNEFFGISKTLPTTQSKKFWWKS